MLTVQELDLYICMCMRLLNKPDLIKHNFEYFSSFQNSNQKFTCSLSYYVHCSLLSSFFKNFSEIIIQHLKYIVITDKTKQAHPISKSSEIMCMLLSSIDNKVLNVAISITMIALKVLVTHLPVLCLFCRREATTEPICLFKECYKFRLARHTQQQAPPDKRFSHEACKSPQQDTWFFHYAF